MSIIDDAVGVVAVVARLCGAVLVTALMVGLTAWAIRWAWGQVGG